MSHFTTVDEFTQAVIELDDISQAYRLFEHQCSDELRSEIYSMSAVGDPEPFRSAMHAMGFYEY